MSPELDLSVKLGRIILKNPLVLASGVMGTSPPLLERMARSGAGAVTAKSCGLQGREGHPNPVMAVWEHGLINAIGLTNPGVDEEIELLKATKEALTPLGVPLFASIFAGCFEDFGLAAKKILKAEPDLIEVNISCPNVHDEFGLPFAAGAESAAEVTRLVKAEVNDTSISIKLAPNVPDIGHIAEAVVAAGADMISAINTMPGMVIDADAAQPVLSNTTGGISGPALKPIALQCVAQIAGRVSVPIIGMGGILTGRDAVEMLMAGASAVGIGSALWYRGPRAFELIMEELRIFMTGHNIQAVKGMIGKALKN